MPSVEAPRTGKNRRLARSIVDPATTTIHGFAMNDVADQSNTVCYERVVDLVFVFAGDDLRSALRVLAIINEHLERGLTEACSALSRGEQTLSLADTHQTFLDREFEIATLLSSLQNNIKRAGRLSESPLHGEDALTDRAACGTEREPKQTFAGAALLSPRERTILELIARGQSNKEIARELGITPETVKSHVKNIFNKLEVGKRGKAVARAAAVTRHGKTSAGN
jgi:DNA-binding CsgD family transcriptional regulator